MSYYYTVIEFAWISPKISPRKNGYITDIHPLHLVSRLMAREDYIKTYYRGTVLFYHVLTDEEFKGFINIKSISSLLDKDMMT